jgi:hypothetical protein
MQVVVVVVLLTKIAQALKGARLNTSACGFIVGKADHALDATN